MDGSAEILCGLVVAGGDRTELLEFAEEVFDQVALFVEIAVEVARCEAVWPRRDDGGFAGAGQGFEDARVGIVGLVGDQPIGRHLRQQRVGADQIVRLSRGQPKGQRIAERVDQRMDLGAQPAAATPDSLIVVFF